MPNGHDSYPSQCALCATRIPYREHRWARRDPPERLVVQAVHPHVLPPRTEATDLAPVCISCAAMLKSRGPVPVFRFGEGTVTFRIDESERGLP